MRRIVATPQYTNPLAAEIADWLNTCQRIAKALRVYDRNNAMIHQFMDRAMQQLGVVFDKVPEILLTVREDRLRWERDPVLINADRHDGIPFILYRNAFRRLTFERGMTRAELLEFLAAITLDFSTFDQTGEDLLTVLWRLKLPHFRYFTIDALTSVASTGTTTTEEDADAIERIQGDIDSLVARIYGQTQVDDSDLVKGASITREDLEALKQIREGGEEDFDLLDTATARAIAQIPKREVALLSQALVADDRDALVARLLDVLFHLLFNDRSTSGTARLLELVQQLFDGSLLAGKLTQATAMVARLRQTEGTDNLQAVHVSRHLLKVLSNESRMTQILGALNDGRHASAPHEVLDLLRTIGPSANSVLLDLIDTITSAGNRKLVCELIAEQGLPDAAQLLDRLQRSSQLVVLDLLGLAQRLPRDDLAPVLLWAVEHETPKVRAFAVGLLRPYPSGVADELVVKALRDSDATVRAAAFRVVGYRKHASYRAALEALVRNHDELWSRDPRELTTLMLAYAMVAGDEAVPVLEKVVNPGFFARSKMTGAQVAAAMALGRVGTAAAREVLVRSSRTLNTKVRDACRAALSRENDAEAEELMLTPAHGTPMPELSVVEGKERVSDMDLAGELTRGSVEDPLLRARSNPVRPRGTNAAAPRPTARHTDDVGVVRRATPTVDHIPERLARASIKVDSVSEPRVRRESSSAGHPTVPEVTSSRPAALPPTDDLSLEAPTVSVHPPAAALDDVLRSALGPSGASERASEAPGPARKGRHATLPPPAPPPARPTPPLGSTAIGAAPSPAARVEEPPPGPLHSAFGGSGAPGYSAPPPRARASSSSQLAWSPPAPPGASAAPPSATPVQGLGEAPTPPRVRIDPPSAPSLAETPTPGEGTRVPTPHYAERDGAVPAAATPARGVVTEWVPSLRRPSMRSAPYGSAAISSPPDPPRVPAEVGPPPLEPPRAYSVEPSAAPRPPAFSADLPAVPSAPTWEDHPATVDRAPAPAGRAPAWAEPPAEPRAAAWPAPPLPEIPLGHWGQLGAPLSGEAMETPSHGVPSPFFAPVPPLPAPPSVGSSGTARGGAGSGPVPHGVPPPLSAGTPLAGAPPAGAFAAAPYPSSPNVVGAPPAFGGAPGPSTSGVFAPPVFGGAPGPSTSGVFAPPSPGFAAAPSPAPPGAFAPPAAPAFAPTGAFAPPGVFAPPPAGVFAPPPPGAFAPPPPPAFAPPPPPGAFASPPPAYPSAAAYPSPATSGVFSSPVSAGVSGAYGSPPPPASARGGLPAFPPPASYAGAPGALPLTAPFGVGVLGAPSISPAHGAPAVAASSPSMGGPPFALSSPPAWGSAPSGFADGLEDDLAAPRPLRAPAAPTPRIPRAPERTRDLAPLPPSHDSGSHPTWDDEPSGGER